MVLASRPITSLIRCAARPVGAASNTFLPRFSALLRSFVKIDFAKEVNRQIGILTNGKAMPQLFIACPGLSVSKEVREWGVTDSANKYTLTSAVVCNLLSHRIIGNFLIRVQKPPRPTKMFSNFEGAVEWLTASMQ